MEKVLQWRGHSFNQRTIDMLTAAEALYGGRFVIIQGSYNKGVVDSAGTHDGGGAVDIRTRDMTQTQRDAAELALRRVGFAAWQRTTKQGFDAPHIHAEAVDDPDLSPEAQAQVDQYHAGTNGLKGKGKDDGPRDYVGVTWEDYQKTGGFTVGQYENLMQQIKNEGAATRQEVRRQAIWMLRYGVQTEDERARADKAFDDAIEAGKTLAEAIAAVSAVMRPISDDLEKRAKANG